MILRISFYFQTDIMTRAELAFGALDRNKKGFITAKEGHWAAGMTTLLPDSGYFFIGDF